MQGDTKCPQCGRWYVWDFCLGILRETISSERIWRQWCAHCQKPVTT